MTDTNPGGWHDAARPGYPKDPERSGPHFIDIAGDVIVAQWWCDECVWTWGDRHWVPMVGAVVSRYLGPCHTPAEVAAQVEAARRDEREANITACRKAVPRAHTYASENADIYRAGDAARDMCIAAIRARGDA